MLRKLSLTIITALFLHLTLSFATPFKSRIFKGVIDNQYPVTVHIAITDNDCSAWYFYDKYRKDIACSCSIKGQELILQEEGSNKGTITGNFSHEYTKFEGTWSNKSKNQRMRIMLHSIYKSNTKNNLDYNKVKAFQEFLNLFPATLSAPITIKEGIPNLPPSNWYKDAKRPSTRTSIPYKLANRYIMDRTNLQLESAFDYLNIDENRYVQQGLMYRPIGKVWETDKYVALLFHFVEDTGWDIYEVSFILVFDYEGIVLDGIVGYAYTIVEEVGKMSSQKANCILKNKGILEVNNHETNIEYGSDPHSNRHFYKEEEHLVWKKYQLSENGKFSVLEKKNIVNKR